MGYLTLCYRASDNQLSFCSCLAGARMNTRAASHTRAKTSSLNRSSPFHSGAILAKWPNIQGILRLVSSHTSSLASRNTRVLPSRLVSFFSFPTSFFIASRSCLDSVLSPLVVLVSYFVSSRVCPVLSCLVSRSLGLLVSWSLGLLVP